MIKINLLPVKEKKKQATIERQIVAAIVVLLAVLAATGYMVVMRKATIKDQQKLIANNQKELERLKGVQTKVEQFKKDNENLSEKIRVISGLESGRDWYLQILDQMSDCMPREVWIESLNTPAGSSIYTSQWQIRGSALEKDQISNFMSNMERKTSYFGIISLKRVDKVRGSSDSGSYYSFEMSIQVKSPPQARPEAS